MDKKAYFFISLLTFSSTALFSSPSLEEESFGEEMKQETSETTKQAFTSFTGKVTSSKVRMRTGPTLDSHILTELGPKDLVLVQGEEEDFFAVAPPPSTKAYIFRTFVLDGKVEGTGVNVRLSPTTESPVIAQLNTGDKVTGIISKENSKWLEIEPPASANFYIAKDYVEKVGDANYIVRLQERETEMTSRLENVRAQAENELEKPFEEMEVKAIQEELTSLISEFEKDFPTQIADARNFQEELQDTYLQRKVDFLESQTKFYSQKLEESQDTMETAQRDDSDFRTTDIISAFDESALSFGGDVRWMEAERNFFSTWVEENPGATPEDFDLEQSIERKTVEGILRPYSRSIKNAPGDYLLYDPKTNVPVAFIYSTKIDLQKKVGKKITVEVNKRPNHHYAFPAFHASEMR